jgi:protocatechuate 3,4-dioxygenase beta subunit
MSVTRILLGTLAGLATIGMAGTGAAGAATCTATPAQTEGPYYRAGAPQRTVLATAGVRGTRLVVSGRVLDPSCRPVARARVDVWQADGSGAYDNAGYRLRGWVRTDARGRYRFTTVVPGQYPGRTEHIHVKITPPGGDTLTTQLYFPNAGANDGDFIYDRRLLVRLDTSARPWRATFTFVAPR